MLVSKREGRLQWTVALPFYECCVANSLVMNGCMRCDDAMCDDVHRCVMARVVDFMMMRARVNANVCDS